MKRKSQKCKKEKSTQDWYSSHICFCFSGLWFFQCIYKPTCLNILFKIILMDLYRTQLITTQLETTARHLEIGTICQSTPWQKFNSLSGMSIKCSDIALTKGNCRSVKKLTYKYTIITLLAPSSATLYSKFFELLPSAVNKKRQQREWKCFSLSVNMLPSLEYQDMRAMFSSSRANSDIPCDNFAESQSPWNLFMLSENSWRKITKRVHVANYFLSYSLHIFLIAQDKKYGRWISC